MTMRRNHILHAFTAQSLLITTFSPLPSGTQGTPYSTSINAAGGVAPYSFSLLSGTLDSGVTLASSGVISGTPANVEVDSIVVKVTDANGSTATKPFNVTFLPSGAASNPMGIGIAAGSAGFSFEGQPWSTDRVLEARGFTNPASSYAYCPVDANGWPVGDFGMVLNEGSTQTWWSGTFKCGFKGNGTETITNMGSCVVTKTSGASTDVRFDLVPSGGTFGFQVTGTTAQADRNVFAYLPAYASFAAGGWSGDANGTIIRVRTEFINFYKNYNHLRSMWFDNAWGNGSLTTWANRNSAINTKSNKGWDKNDSGPVAINTIGYPIEWFIQICNQVGVNAYCNMPENDDGTYATNAALLLASTLNGNAYIEYSNELWGGYRGAGGAANTFQAATAAAGLSLGQYLAVQQHRLAIAFKAAYGVSFGAKCEMLAAWQTGGSGIFVLGDMLTYYTANFGPPGSDMHWLSQAPYFDEDNTSVPGDGVNHNNTPGESVAQIEANWTANGNYICWIRRAEGLNALAIANGLKGIMSYEMGQNAGGNVSPTNPFTANWTVAAMDAANQAVCANYLQNFFNAGFKRATWFESGVLGQSNNMSPFWTLSTDTAALESTGSPRSRALAQFFTFPTLTHRNTVAVVGTTDISAVNYLDNTVAMNAALPALHGAGSGGYQLNTAAWIIFNPTNAAFTKSLSVPSAVGSTSTNVQLNGVQIATGVTFATGATLCNVTLPPGLNFLLIGTGSFGAVDSFPTLRFS